MRLKPWHAALGAGAAAFLVYFKTLAPGVDWIDAGELATVCSTLGIAHPTGYPLFTLLGWLFTHLPIAGSVIARANRMAALFTALGVAATVLLMHEIAQEWMRWGKAEPAPTQKRKKSKGSPGPPASVSPEQASGWTRCVSPALLAAFAAGLAAAFSQTWWNQATAIEVYPLHLVFLPGVLLAFLRMLRLDPKDSGALTRNAVVFAGLLGLSFTNHMTTLFLAPACLILFFWEMGFFNRAAWQKIARMAIPFAAALLLYLYLPLRSAAGPLLDWGHPASLPALLKHMSGGQYSIWMFSGSAGHQWAHFWHRAPQEFTLAGFLTALLGLVGIFTMESRARKKLLALTALLFFGCVLYAIHYSIHDIDPYFLLAFLTLALWIGCATRFLLHLLRQQRAAWAIGLAAALLLAGIELHTHYAQADESGNHMVDDHTQNLLRNLPPNAVIFSTLWDFWVSGSYYYQQIERLRPDVLVIDKALLHDRAWYHDYLRKRAPEVMRRVTAEEDAFLKHLRRFEAGKPFDRSGIVATYNAFIEALVLRNPDRPAFITPELVQDQEDPFLPKIQRLPDGVAWRLLRPSDTAIPAATLPVINFHGDSYPRRNYYTDNSRFFQAQPLAATAEWLAAHGRPEEARRFIALALQFKPVPADPARDDLDPTARQVVHMTDARFAHMEEIKKRIQ